MRVHARFRQCRGMRHALARSITFVVLGGLPVCAQDRVGDTARANAASGEQAGGSTLAEREASLALRYQNLERSLLRLADLMAASDPQRAALLRSAFERSSTLGVGERLEVIAALLEEGAVH